MFRCNKKFDFDDKGRTAWEKRKRKMQIDNKYPFNYKGCCARTLNESRGVGGIGELNTTGVASCTFFGDGDINVFAIMQGDRPRRLLIDFDGDVTETGEDDEYGDGEDYESGR
jgi:hypothetical protein